MKKADKILKRLRIYEAFDLLGSSQNRPKGEFNDVLQELKNSPDKYKITGYDEQYEIITLKYNDKDKDYGTLFLTKIQNDKDKHNYWEVGKQIPNSDKFQVWNYADPSKGFITNPKIENLLLNLTRYIKNIYNKRNDKSQYGNEAKDIIEFLDNKYNNTNQINSLTTPKEGEKNVILDVKGKKYKVIDSSKNKNTFTITKDQERFYVISADKTKDGKTVWNIAIPDERSQSDYQFYNKDEDKFVKANGEIKKEHPNLTNYIRNTNFKTDIKNKAKETTKDVAKGAGEIVGTILGGPLGGYLGKKAAAWASDKFLG